MEAYPLANATNLVDLGEKKFALTNEVSMFALDFSPIHRGN